jgi:hypothetical protein
MGSSLTPGTIPSWCAGKRIRTSSKAWPSGFTPIRGALHAVESVFRLSAWRRGQVLSSLEGDREDRKARSEALTQYAEAILGFTVEELAAVSELPVPTCASLLKRLSQDFGYRNSQHPKTFTDPKKKRHGTSTGFMRGRSCITTACIFFLYRRSWHRGLQGVLVRSAGR